MARRFSHFATALVEVHNRTTEKLTCRYDGETVHIAPKGMVHMTPAAAKKAVEQNRVMGTEDPYDPLSFESKVYVIGKGFKNMPTTDLDLTHEGKEALDRSQLPPEAQGVVMNTFRSVRPERARMPGAYAVSRDDDSSPEELSRSVPAE